MSLAALSACQPTTRIVAVRGGLQNIDGAEGGLRPDGASTAHSAGSGIGSLAARMYGTLPGQPVNGNELRRELENGDILLISRTPGELIFHLRRTLRDEEWDLVYDQLLSTKLKEAYEEQGKDPRAALEFVRRHSREIIELLTMVPAADQTPGANFRSIGRNIYRLTIPGGKNVDSTFISMDIVYEDRQFRLRMLN
ncbi:MAG: hypothetical protein ACF8MJ_06335 [Phycisphaerales bacterium JB050]